MTLQEYFNQNQSLLVSTIVVLVGAAAIIVGIILTRRYILKKNREKQQIKIASEALLRAADEFSHDQMLSDSVLPSDPKTPDRVSDAENENEKVVSQFCEDVTLSKTDVETKVEENNDTKREETAKNNSVTDDSEKTKKSDTETNAKEKSKNQPKADDNAVKTASANGEKSADKPVIDTVKPSALEESNNENKPIKSENAATEVPKKSNEKQNGDGEKFRPTRNKTTKNAEKSVAKYAGKWLIYTENGKYAANLVASNGEVLLRSESYTALSGIKSGIETIKNNIAKNNFAISVDKNGNFFFKLYSSSTRLLCISEGYSTKSVCESAIESVKRFSQTAVLEIKKEETK